MIEIKSTMHHGSTQKEEEEEESLAFIPASDEDVENLIQMQDNMCKNIQDQVLFDAVGSQFHLSVFLYQFLVHMFIPLFFFVPNTYGQGLRLTRDSIWFNIMLPCIFYLMVLSFIFMRANDNKIVGYSLWWPFFSYLAHRLMVALKYACLSPTEYKRFNECKDNATSASYLNQMMLFGGWLGLEPNVLFFELGAASARIGERINEVHLIVRNENFSDAARSQVRFWNAFLRGHREINVCTQIAPEMRKIDSGDYAISVHDIATAVLRYCNNFEEFAGAVFIVSQGLAFFIICVSFIPIVRHHAEFISPAVVALFMVSSAIINWVFGRLVFLFLSFVLYDVYRLKKMVSIVHCMIRISDVMLGVSVTLNGRISDKSQLYAEQRREAIIEINQVRSWKGSVSVSRKNKPRSSRSEDYNPRVSNAIGEKSAFHGGEALIPRVAFEFPENILSWAYLRITLQTFGERFRFRTDIYAGFTLAMMLILMLMALIFLIIARNRQEEFGRTYVWESLIAVTILFVYLLLISIMGAMVNEELSLQSRTLASRSLRTRSRMVFREENCCDELENGSDPDKEALAAQLECIDAVMEIVDVNNQLRPFKFLGLTAQYGLSLSILTTAISFYSVLFSLYYSSNSQVSSDLAVA